MCLTIDSHRHLVIKHQTFKVKATEVPRNFLFKKPTLVKTQAINLTGNLSQQKKKKMFMDIVLLLLSLHVQLYKATRILHEDLTTDLSLQSLQRGTIPPSDGSGCTNIPGSGGPSCPLVNEMHYAGNVLPPDTAFPRHPVPFGVATNQS
ncbi:hypothetical protein POTOM_032010 [Populus tomentosa]|uniref:Uncharacterized protein n=1 Tax=Populus tomentosa TaxID=118781 RepID=A0A8X7Z8M4_POPTO|nr:hypothetical protein POTOM_032010 [Populus tomentosa]